MLSLSKRLKIKRVLNIALPSAMQSALDMLSFSIALFFLGDMDKLKFTAIGIGTGYIILLYPFSAIFAIGANVLMAQRYGSKNIESMNVAYSTIFYSVCIASIPILLLAFSCIPVYLKAFNLSEELYNLTYSYLSLSVIAIVAIVIKTMLISGFAATGDTKRPFFIKIFLTILSIIGYTLFIKGNFGFPALGLAGAAYVSIAVSYLELFLLLSLLLFVKTPLKLKLTFDFSSLLKAVKIGIPTGAERIFTIASLNIVLIFVGSYSVIFGDSAMTGFQAGSKIEGFSFVPGFGFMIAITSLMGQSIGAGNAKRGEEYTKICAIMASCVLGIGGLILAILGRELSEIFIKNDHSAIEISIIYLIAVGLSQIPQILSFIYDGALRGAGYSQLPLFINMCSISLFRLLPMWICTIMQAHIYYLFLIIFIETYIRSLIFFLVFKSGIWKRGRKKG